MKILIVGAGIAGMTLAALLKHLPCEVTLIERASDFEQAGYMLGLYALGHRVLYGLDLHRAFERESIECRHYQAYDDRGERLADWSLEPISGKYGPLLSCTRPQLVALLQTAVSGQVRFGCQVTEIETDAEDAVTVRFDDGRQQSYDLVVAADGIGSQVRQRVFGEQPRFDTGWGGWVWWAPETICPAQTFVEYWGAGRFLGAYPTRRGVGIFAGAPLAEDFVARAGRQARLQAHFAGMGQRMERILASLPADQEELFFWHLSDVRSQAWIHRRVVLLGDAAAGFLPTAGIGASMAMESAAVLADELSRTDVQYLDQALQHYVQRRRARVEAIQDDSRRLARIMFVKSTPLAAVRNLAAHFISLETAMGAIVRAFEQPL